MNGLSLLFFFPMIVSGIISVEKIQDKTIPEIEVYKNIQVDSDRSTCACWSQCKVDSECTAVSIVPNSLGGTEASCLLTKLISATVKTQLQTESGAVTFLKDSITGITNVVQAAGLSTAEAATITEATTTEATTTEVTTTEATTTEATTTEATTTEVTTNEATTTEATTTKATSTIPQPVSWYAVPGVGSMDNCNYDEIKSDQTTRKFLLFLCEKEYSESKDFCTKPNGVLASLSDSETYGKIVQILYDNYSSLGNIWVDVTRVSNNAYVWGDGSSLPSKGTSPWHSGKPNGNDGCARILWLGQKYGVDDSSCGNDYTFLCDVDI